MGLEKNLEAITPLGKEEGIIEGKIEGLVICKEEAKEDVAKKLMEMGLDNLTIATATGFSMEKIEHIRKQLH